MSPQRSNRQELIDGALRCLQRLPADRVTARIIAEEAGANLASIAYHFGSKDGLVTAAVIEGLDRWLAEVERELPKLASDTGAQRLRRANEVIERTRRRHPGLVHNFIAALAKAPHDPVVGTQLADGFGRTRPVIAKLFGFGDDRVGRDAAGLALAMFYGQLIQVHVDDRLAIGGQRFDRAWRRLSGDGA